MKVLYKQGKNFSRKVALKFIHLLIIISEFSIMSISIF